MNDQPVYRMVTIEEPADSINAGWFLNRPEWTSATQWGDAPAAYLGGTTAPAFADAHAEMHHGESSTTVSGVTTIGYSSPKLDAAGRADYQWLMERYATRYNP